MTEAGKQAEHFFHRVTHFIARADLFSWALLWLMTLLVTGTLAEKTLGLYLAEQRYFSSPVIWLFDALPLPGVPVVGAWIFAGLAAKLTLEEWRWRKVGTVVVHIGAMLLLLGGFVTARFSNGGSMVIPQGESRDYIEDDEQIELAVSNLDKPGQPGEVAFPAEMLTSQTRLQNARLPFTMMIEDYCRNCGLLRLPVARAVGNPRGVAINFDLKDLPREKIEEDNRAGVTFVLHQAGADDALYTVFEQMPIPEIVTVGAARYLITVRHVRTYLPFSVRLIKFERSFYPGTDKPRSYKSEVVLSDHGVQWHSLIQMNEPLRYKGYTFYQASYIEGGPSAVTVLAVVKNIGRLFPYISSIIIALGLLIHLAQRLPPLLPKGKEA